MLPLPTFGFLCDFKLRKTHQTTNMSYRSTPCRPKNTAQWQKGTRNTAEAANSHKPEMLMIGMERHNQSLTMSEPSVHK
jgi:hypothetical protein